MSIEVAGRSVEFLLGGGEPIRAIAVVLGYRLSCPNLDTDGVKPHITAFTDQQFPANGFATVRVFDEDDTISDAQPRQFELSNLHRCDELPE